MTWGKKLSWRRPGWWMVQSDVLEGVCMYACSFEIWATTMTNNLTDQHTDELRLKRMDQRTHKPKNWWTNELIDQPNQWMDKGIKRWWTSGWTYWRTLSDEGTNLKRSLLAWGGKKRWKWNIKKWPYDLDQTNNDISDNGTDQLTTFLWMLGLSKKSEMI